MKNKKWKRKAKRIIGNCMTAECQKCKFYEMYITNEEVICDCRYGIPVLGGIRNLEKAIKNENRLHDILSGGGIF